MGAALRVLCMLGMLGLLLPLTGCLGSTEEIFAADQAATVPGVEGDYVRQDRTAEDILRVERIAGSAEYAYFDPRASDRDRGRMRAVSVGGDMYLLQMHADRWAAGRYWQILVKLEREHDTVTRVVVLYPEDEAVTALAVRSGIELGPPGAGDAYGPRTLKGSREAIAAFLKELPTLPCREIWSYARV